jgi:hypothetical protein
MNSRTTVLLATVGLWVVVVLAVGYWRMFYAWRLGAAFLFFFQYIPVLSLILAVVLSSELLYFHRVHRNRELKQ